MTPYLLAALSFLSRCISFFGLRQTAPRDGWGTRTAPNRVDATWVWLLGSECPGGWLCRAAGSPDCDLSGRTRH